MQLNTESKSPEFPNTPVKPTYRTAKIGHIIDQISEKIGFPLELVKHFREQQPAFRQATFSSVPDTKLNIPGEHFWLIKLGGRFSPDVIVPYAALFQLFEFPGCCGMSILSDVRVSKLKLGIGTLVHELAEEMSASAGYTYMVVTDIVKHEPEQKIWNKRGYKTIHQFRSARTRNLLGMAIKQVKEEPTSEPY